MNRDLQTKKLKNHYLTKKENILNEEASQTFWPLILLQ
jgi:hypothetical protein